MTDYCPHRRSPAWLEVTVPGKHDQIHVVLGGDADNLHTRVPFGHQHLRPHTRRGVAQPSHASEELW